MADKKVDGILQRYADLQSEHQNWRSDWQDLADYVHPVRSGFTSRRQSGQKKTARQFDGTAPAANRRLAAAMAGSLISRAFQWFGLKFRDEAMNEQDEAVEWLEDCAIRMTKSFNHSNFYAEAHSMFLDLGGFGTGALMMDERESKGGYGGLVTMALPLADYVIDEDAEGRVNTLFRVYDLSVGAAAAEWGADKLGEKARKLYEDGKFHQRLAFLHAVYPREYGKTGRNVTKGQKPWASCTVEMGDKALVNEGGFDEFPFMVVRWEKASSERYGTGPGHLALPDVRTLNRAIELGLKTWAKTLDAPLKTTDDGVIGIVDSTPGGVTKVRDMAALDVLYPRGTFTEGAAVSQTNVADTRAMIRDRFYADQLSLPDDSTPRTAFEIAKRFELMQRLLGPTLGRLESEFLNPCIERKFNMMMRKGAFLPMPAGLSEAAWDVEYQGPLAKSQRLAEVEGMERLQSFATAIAQFSPEVMDVIDPDGEVRIAADVLGVPAKAMRSAEQVEAIRKQRASEKAQQSELDQEEQAATALGKGAPGLALMQGQGAQGGR